MNNFDKYFLASEPHKWELTKVWKVAIGLQTEDEL